MTTRNNHLGAENRAQVTQDVDDYLEIMRYGKPHYQARELLRESRRLLGSCTRLRNSLRGTGMTYGQFDEEERDLAHTYLEIRSHQNALLRYLHEPELTTLPAWVNRCFR